MVEQRYLAVREVLDTDATITDVATRYGVDRRTLHRWLLRYASGGLGALADHSSRPDTCPHQIDPAVEARIVALRRAHPGWGPRTILNRLRRELEVVPSRSAIYRAMVRQNLIDPKPRRRRHLPELDEHLDRRSKAARPARPTKGEEVSRGVDPGGSVSFAGTAYRVGNAYRGMLAGVRIVGDTVQITIDGRLVRTHRARHDKAKEFGALAQPNGKPRRSSGVA